MEANLDGVLHADPQNNARREASRLPLGHIRLADMELFTGRKLDSWKLIFAVLRDPYEQQLSQWSFWRDRYAKGGRHFHDQAAAAYKTLAEWLGDDRCDFHTWYIQQIHEGKSINADSGYYRFWLEVDGEIPRNVTILDIDSLNEQVPKLLAPFTNPPRALKISDVEVLNTSPHSTKTREYYTPKAARLVEEKFKWAFAEGNYRKWLYSDAV
jgi:hypothetical protein